MPFMWVNILLTRNITPYTAVYTEGLHRIVLHYTLLAFSMNWSALLAACYLVASY